MKKAIFLAMLFLALKNSEAQIIPSFNFGLKAGINLSKFNPNQNFTSQNKVGYLGGVWFRLSALGFMLQPEVYYADKSISIVSSNGTQVNSINFTSVDIPVLAGYQIGALGIGGRLNTGPVLSVPVGSSRQPGNAAFTSQKNSYAWQFGGGLDVKKLSFDVRYEAGLSYFLGQGNDSNRKLNLFNFSISYKLL